jgi:hypothetical protein
MKVLGISMLFCALALAARPARGQPAAAAPAAPARTYALLVASNEGGLGQERLRYAENDAERVADVLIALGGYDPERVQRLIAPSAEALRAALVRLEEQLAADAQAGEQSMLFLYYSGHARADALSLGRDTLSLAELRERVTALPSTLSIVVLDACQSGAISRVKGAAPASDFSFNSVQRLNTAGIAVMASSSALELSQESDELESSYFTHHLLVGLRGGGDDNRDGRVTLAEAYAYAYNHTLAQTAATKVGEQHVTLETNFSGKGEVPITYPARASSRLRIPAQFTGRVILQKLPSWSVLGEVNKAKGAPLELALPAGEYVATVRRDDVAARCPLRIAEGATSVLDSRISCTRLVDRDARAKGEAGRAHPTAAEDGDEGFALELLAGFGGYVDDDAYSARLQSFGFESDGATVGRYSVALARRLHPHLLVGASFANLESASFVRENETAVQDFVWESYAVGPFVQGDVAFGSGRVAMLFARAGGGLAYGWSTFDVVADVPSFADDDPSFQDTTVDTRAEEESFTGGYFTGGGGVAVHPHDNFGFQFEVRYVLAPALENRTGETHDLGGLSFLLGLRLRTWE